LRVHVQRGVVLAHVGISTAVARNTLVGIDSRRGQPRLAVKQRHASIACHTSSVVLAYALTRHVNTSRMAVAVHTGDELCGAHGKEAILQRCLGRKIDKTELKKSHVRCSRRIPTAKHTCAHASTQPTPHTVVRYPVSQTRRTSGATKRSLRVVVKVEERFVC
jgi:hypothetical protein